MSDDISFQGLSPEDLAYRNLMPYASYMWPHRDFDEEGKPIWKYKPNGTVIMQGNTPAWFHKYIANRFEELERRDTERIALSMPPRHGKTKLLNQFIAWYIGRNPGHSIIHASANQKNANKFGREIRNVIQGKSFQQVFPGITLASDSNSTSEFEICTSDSEEGKTERGSYFACGTGTNTQGRKGDLIVLDDIIGKGDQASSKDAREKLWEWYLSDAYSRLEPSGVVIMNQTRWWEDDIIGRALSEQKHEGWLEIKIPVINKKGEWLWPERFSVEDYERRRLTQSSRNWNALYMQSPVQDDGDIFKRSEFKIYPSETPLPEFEFILQSYDTAYGEGQDGDYNAAVTLGIFNAHKWCPERPDVDAKYTTRNQYGIMLIDAWHDRIAFPEMRQIMAEEYDSTFGGRKTDLVIVEGKATGLSLIQELRLTGIPVKSIIPKNDKRSRAYSIQHLLEGGHVWIPENKRKKGEFRDWSEPFLKELIAFDKGQHDDFVDAFVQGIRYLSDTGWIRGDPLVEQEEDLTPYLRKKRESAYG